MDIELVTNTVVGLKIPLTSIVTKDFYVIPSRMATTQDNQTGFTLYEGKNKTTFKNVSIYASIDDSSVSNWQWTKQNNLRFIMLTRVHLRKGMP